MASLDVCLEKCFAVLLKGHRHRLHSAVLKHLEMFAVTLPSAVGTELGWGGQPGQWELFTP